MTVFQHRSESQLYPCHFQLERVRQKSIWHAEEHKKDCIPRKREHRIHQSLVYRVSMKPLILLLLSTATCIGLGRGRGQRGLCYASHSQIRLSQREDKTPPILEADKNELEKKPSKVMVANINPPCCYTTAMSQLLPFLHIL